MKWWRRTLTIAMSSLVLILVINGTATAQYVSPSYSVEQVQFGSGGELSQTSPNYQARSSVGELGVGNSSSPNYQIHAGFNTTDQPFLEFVVTGSNIDLGYLNTASVTTATATFSIRAWNSGGYVVRNQGNAPKSIGPSPHTLTSLSVPTASSPGTEQFGINLVKNTNFCGVGCDLGADPVQVPDNTFSFGQAQSPGYSTVNMFKYVSTKAIANSTQSTSITDFTISYIFNISTATPAGKYTFTHILVATATY